MNVIPNFYGKNHTVLVIGQGWYSQASGLVHREDPNTETFTNSIM